MKMELYFKEEIIWESIYDTLCNFFFDQNNIEELLKEDHHDVLMDLANEIRDAISCTLPSEIQVL